MSGPAHVWFTRGEEEGNEAETRFNIRLNFICNEMANSSSRSIKRNCRSATSAAISISVFLLLAQLKQFPPGFSRAFPRGHIHHRLVHLLPTANECHTVPLWNSLEYRRTGFGQNCKHVLHKKNVLLDSSLLCSWHLLWKLWRSSILDLVLVLSVPPLFQLFTNSCFRLGDRALLYKERIRLFFSNPPHKLGGRVEWRRTWRLAQKASEKPRFLLSY